eukprot:1137776-Pelagomonas_calceolata.AAC.2
MSLKANACQNRGFLMLKLGSVWKIGNVHCWGGHAHFPGLPGPCMPSSENISRPYRCPEQPYNTGPASFVAAHGQLPSVLHSGDEHAGCVSVLECTEQASWGACVCNRLLATHTASSQPAAAATCVQVAFTHAMVQVWDRLSVAAAGSRVLLPAGQQLCNSCSATAAVAAAVWSRCFKLPKTGESGGPSGSTVPRPNQLLDP